MILIHFNVNDDINDVELFYVVEHDKFNDGHNVAELFIVVDPDTFNDFYTYITIKKK